ncbi:ATP-binding cassette domain-containing protein [Atopobiaceae bacterium 24-176]
MLELKDVVKTYPVGNGEVQALRGVSLSFRNSEFVAVLGQSGCGKTTLLNIVGGLDQYTSGDLLVDGRSTKHYSDADWDAYRNHSIGFVFQSYNLIPHQTVLANVELALTLDGVSASERTRRAAEALDRVGLGDQLSKKPAMMSGGQMQRVAIARAIVNNPGIILADEPTGALDSKTSVQIMDLLKEISEDRLVVMVTHNPELAEDYATRIVRLSDGQVLSDSNPPTAAELAAEPVEAKPKHTRLPFLTALALSANNLRTKKGRTFLTAFAGAIGIIGIALILSLSNGMNDYIAGIESDTMGAYPITISRQTVDMMGAMSEDSISDRMEIAGHGTSGNGDGESDAIVSNNVVAKTVEQIDTLVKTNNLAAFRTYIEGHRADIDPYVSNISYRYDVSPQVWRTEGDGVSQVAPRTLLDDSGAMAQSMLASSPSTSSQWGQLVDDQALREGQYSLRAGSWPQTENEVALVVDENGRVSDFVLYTLGLLDEKDMDELIGSVEAGEQVDDPAHTVAFDDAIGKEYTVFSPSQLYEEKDGVYVDKGEDASFVAQRMGEGVPVKVTGVLEAGDGAPVSSGVVYTEALTSKLMALAAEQPVVKAQLADPDKNVLTGESFEGDDGSAAAGMDSAMSVMTSMFSRTSDGGAGFASDGVWRGGKAAAPGLWRPSVTVTVPVADVPASGGSGATAAAGSGGAAGGAGAAAPGTDTITVDLYQLSPEQRALVEAVVSGNVSAEELQEHIRQQVLGSITPEEILSRLTDEQKRQIAQQLLANVTPEQMVAMLTPDQRAQLMADVVKSLTDEQKQQMAQELGVQTDPAQILTAMTPDQRDAMVAQFMASDEGKKLMEGYMASIDKDALIAEYMKSADTDALMREYMANMDTSALMAQYLQGMDTQALMEEYLSSLSPEELAEMSGMGSLDQDQIDALMARYSNDTPTTYDGVLTKLGYASQDRPDEIVIYPKDFEAKKGVEDFIAAYNAQVSADADKVTYNDLVGMMTSSVTDIINMITMALLAFVAISLVVSSIMIAIITYISVLERTKEIGVLRALGCSKGGVTRIFTAETFIEGLLAGILGVATAVLIDIPICMAIEQGYGVAGIAVLPPADGLVLVAISVALTLVAGFIPSRMAAKKDPVEALRSE